MPNSWNSPSRHAAPIRSIWPTAADDVYRGPSSPSPLAQNATGELTYVSGDQITAQLSLLFLSVDPTATFWPQLQRADGVYIGTVGTICPAYGECEALGQLLNENSAHIAAVGRSGVVWQRHFTTPTGSEIPVLPLFATADGGAIVTSTQRQGFGFDFTSFLAPRLGSLYTLDSNGNVASQSADTGAVPSWTNQWYVDPPETVSSVVQNPIHFVNSWAAILGQNHSGTGAAVQQQWFPPLPSCSDSALSPPISCPGPQEAMNSALAALKSLVGSPCLNCAAFVFQKLGSLDDQADFSRFLNLHPGMFDATRSNMPLKQICNWGSWSGFLCSLSLTNNKETISQAFLQVPPGQTILAMSQMPAKNGLMTFWNPAYVCKVYAAPNYGIFNQSELFHESLHGFYGKNDGTIQQAFGLTVDPSNSISISYYIQQKIFGEVQGICAN